MNNELQLFKSCLGPTLELNLPRFGGHENI